MSPAEMDPGSAWTRPSGNSRFKPDRKEDIRKEEWVLTWRTLSPFVKENVKNDVISEFPLKNQTLSGIATVAQRPGATANVVRQNRPRGMQKRRWKRRRAPFAGCSVLRHIPSDIKLSTLRIVPAKSQISRRVGHIPPQILNLLMKQNENHWREGQPPPESRGPRAMVNKLGGRTVMGQATPSWEEEKSVELRGSCHGIVREMTAILTRTPRRRRAGELGVDITAIAIMWTSSSELIPGWAKMPLFRGWTNWITPPQESLRAKPSSTTI